MNDDAAWEFLEGSEAALKAALHRQLDAVIFCACAPR